MRKNKESSVGIRVICLVLFLAFALCWLNMQRDILLSAVGHKLPVGDSVRPFSIVYICLLFICFILIPVPLSRLFFRFNNGLYACNYALSAFLLGCLTAYDGHHLLPQSLKIWIAGLSILLMILVIARIISFRNRKMPDSGAVVLSSNLFIMSILFCVTALLGNTDENLHRKLRIESLLSNGEYEKALRIGENEEETDPSITLLRVKAMLGLDAEKPGSGVGDHLFLYPLSDVDILIDSLKSMQQDSAYDTHALEIAVAMLEADIAKAESLISLLAHGTDIPVYYLQLLMMSDNGTVPLSAYASYNKERENYDSFNQLMAQLKNEPFQIRANSSYIQYHKTYYWYYTFCRP